MVVLAPLNKSVPVDVARLFEEKKRAIIDGNLVPFAGPIKDNGGATKLGSGSALTHEQLMAINWYVDGVDGPYLNDRARAAAGAAADSTAAFE